MPGMSTVMQLDVSPVLHSKCCLQRGRAKLAGLAFAEEISSDGANRQRVDADLLAANAETAFLVSDGDRVGAQHIPP